MKKPVIALLLFFMIGSCTKSAIPDASLTGEAVITRVKYACGPYCDAATWAVQFTDQEIYEPIDLPANFQVNELAVTLIYKKTGAHSAPGQGTGEEKIAILHIEKR